MKLKKRYFVSGIDTDAGKSYATGWLARTWIGEGVNVITQKFVQTGCEGISEDIALHRNIMGCGLLPFDLDRTTCPASFAFPASPDLAARMEGRRIDLSLIGACTEKLSAQYDTVLIEGAGGLMVPLNGLYTTLDYVAEQGLPLILVTNPRLGSISHTLLSLEACLCRGVPVDFLAYNLYPQTSPQITDDTRCVLKEYIGEKMPGCIFIEIPYIG